MKSAFVLVLAIIAFAVGMQIFASKSTPQLPAVTDNPIPDSISLSSTAEHGVIKLTGSYEESGQKILFSTARGPRTSFFARLNGAPEYEMGICLANEAGTPLYSSSGGDFLMNECAQENELTEEEPEKLAQDMKRMRHALETLLSMEFNPYFEPEQQALANILTPGRQIETHADAYIEQSDGSYRKEVAPVIGIP